MVAEGRDHTRKFGCKGMVGNSTFETTKEDASVVDSSLTESKHDLENFDSPECSISRNNEECTAGIENHINLSHNAGGFSQIVDANVYTRYFVIKSLSRENIDLSVEKGIWATQVMNEPILEEAFHNSNRVILIFSVNMSGYFQGYAQMMSPVSWKRDNLWSKSGGGNNSWGRTFKVKWLRLCDLPFQKTLHLKNPLNDFKPVKISRDCQELATDIGEALCTLFDGEVDMLGNMNSSSPVDDVNYKRPCRSLPVHFEQENNMPFKHAQTMRWSNSSMSTPPLLYPQLQYEENFHHLILGKPPKLPFHQNSNSCLKPESNMSREHPLQQNRGNMSNLQKHSSKKDVLPKEVSSLSLSEEEFLSMTYEEYLQAFGRISASSRSSQPSSSHRTTSNQTRSR